MSPLSARRRQSAPIHRFQSMHRHTGLSLLRHPTEVARTHDSVPQTTRKVHNQPATSTKETCSGIVFARHAMFELASAAEHLRRFAKVHETWELFWPF